MESTIRGPAGLLHIYDGGEGDLPLIFAHSLGGNLAQWSGVLDEVQQRHRVLAFDLRGHGASEPPADDDFAVAAQAGDLLAVLDDRCIDRAIFVGHSLGAMIAIAAAARAPARCAGLFLEDPGSDPSLFPQEQVDHYLGLFATQYEQMVGAYWDQLLEGAAPANRASVLETLRATPQRTVHGCFRDLGRFQATEALRSFGGPTFVFAGPMGAQPGSLQQVLGLPCEQVEGTSHYVHLDAQPAFTGALERFAAERT